MRRKLFIAFALFGFLYIAKGQDNFTVFTNASQTTRAFNLFSSTPQPTVPRDAISDPTPGMLFSDIFLRREMQTTR